MRTLVSTIPPGGADDHGPPVALEQEIRLGLDLGVPAGVCATGDERQRDGRPTRRGEAHGAPGPRGRAQGGANQG